MLKVEDLKEMLLQQEKLDQYIYHKNDVEDVSDIFKEKIIALEVELSEFANEVRFFKYWQDKEVNKEKALFEYVDSLHFFLSLFNDYGVTAEAINDYLSEYQEENKDNSFLNIYAHAKRWALTLMVDKERESHLSLMIAFNYFMNLGKKLNFEREDILRAYKEKRMKNYERQEVGY